MERLTMRNDACIAFWADPRCAGGGYRPENRKDQERLDRLAAYEDAGLTPEEISGLCSMSDRAKMADLLRLEEYQALGTIDHLRELVQAEKDGRLVVLPCKPDATAYQWKKGDDIPSLFRFDGVTINEDKEITYQTHWGETFTPDDFGKIVFLTRKEAEAALKKMEEAKNHGSN